MPVYDLHSHSTASDGTLTPAGVVARARGRGVDVLALTDHDSVAGIGEAMRAAQGSTTRLIPGTEISVTWQKHTIHMLGLDIDPRSASLEHGLRQLQKTRSDRAQLIGERLDKCGIKNALAETKKLFDCTNITRTHFARHLVHIGKARSERHAFKSYLGPGKPGYVQTRWANLAEAISWIKDAGGLAVIAHPSRYSISLSTMRQLLGEFVKQGGVGLEVVHGTSTTDEVSRNSALAIHFGLLGSIGSDFHDPDHAWIDLGKVGTLPTGVTPIWERFKKGL
ncbi:MAG: PHP domain-containing protein [Gammaproteobacteria bacterium]|nr:PHP domain-containing protein [Gammaproteobacteria bacterium]